MVTEDVHLLMFEENIRCRQKGGKKVLTEQDIYNPNQISGLSYQIVTFGNCRPLPYKFWKLSAINFFRAHHT
jgi:hypothetical protein